MFNKNDLRGIVTIVMLFIFILAIFIPVMTQVFTGVDVIIPETFVQAVIQLTTMVVAFYFTNRATRDKMDEGTYHSLKNGYFDEKKEETGA